MLAVPAVFLNAGASESMMHTEQILCFLYLEYKALSIKYTSQQRNVLMS